MLRVLGLSRSPHVRWKDMVKYVEFNGCATTVSHHSIILYEHQWSVSEYQRGGFSRIHIPRTMYHVQLAKAVRNLWKHLTDRIKRSCVRDFPPCHMPQPRTRDLFMQHFDIDACARGTPESLVLAHPSVRLCIHVLHVKSTLTQCLLPHTANARFQSQLEECPDASVVVYDVVNLRTSDINNVRSLVQLRQSWSLICLTGVRPSDNEHLYNSSDKNYSLEVPLCKNL